MGYLDFIQNHFLHALPILIGGAIAISIIIERTKALFWTYPLKEQKAFFEKISEYIKSGRTADAVALCDQYPDKPITKIVKTALLRAHLPEEMIIHGLEMAHNETTHTLQKRTSFLATIANVTVLLGLFGTIAGLIHSFEAVGHADPQQKSALLAAGISTAMNATMSGLAVAIPCMVAFSFLMNRQTQLSSELEAAGIKIIDLIKQYYYAVDVEFDNQSQSAVSNGHAKPAADKESKVTPIKEAA